MNQLEQNAQTMDQYEEKRKPTASNPSSQTKIVIWSDIENWIEHELVLGRNETQIVNEWKKEVDDLLIWEQQAKVNQVIIIGNDQSKGIVPIDQTKRFVRDIIGWCHQYTAQKAERVTRIWYGIPEELKIKEEQK